MNGGFAAILRIGGHDLGHGPALSRDLDTTADLQAKVLHVLRIDAGNRSAHILGLRFYDLKSKLRVCLRSHHIFHARHIPLAFKA